MEALTSMPHAPALRLAHAPGLPLRGLRVLLVEDDPEVRETVAALLVEDGATVTPAADARAAFALLAAPGDYDLLFSDVMLPGGLSGLDVVAYAAQARPMLPALLHSGYVGPGSLLGRTLPPDVLLLHKPYRHTDLLAAITATLDRAGPLRA